MLRRIRQLKNLGRFTTFDHPIDDALRFQRLTLIYAHNASGKTTLARLLASAGTGDGRALDSHRTLQESDPPEVTLEFDQVPVCRFDGTRWTGDLPRIRVFDRDFIEANVAVGQRPHKATRAGLLEIALGSEAVASKLALDRISERGRALASELRPHAAAIETAAKAAHMSETSFLELAPVADEPAERQRLTDRQRDANTASEVRKRAQPGLLPALPDLHFDAITEVLARGAARLGADAEATVRSHLEGRLRGRGHTWVREGLQHDDGATCPYCGQGTADVEMIRHYRVSFDAAWDGLVADVEAAAKSVEKLDVWWTEVRQVGLGNLAAFTAWSDLVGLACPDLDSRQRRVELEGAKAALTKVFALKRARPGDALEAAEGVGLARGELGRIAGSVVAYNRGVDEAVHQIQARCDTLASLSVDEADSDLRLLNARVLRHGHAIDHAASEQVRLGKEKEANERAKRQAEETLQAQSEAQLDAFGRRVNLLLDDLGAHFRLEKLGTERSGGTSAARFTMTVDLGVHDRRSVAVASKAGEEGMARVLSDGDRSTLALAVFLAGLQRTADLNEHIVVFDDPMTSLDVHRCTATAEKVVAVARACKQVIVLSHHAAFLAQVATAWRRVGVGDAFRLAEVELARGSRTIVPWCAEDAVAHEHLRRYREIRAFVDDAGLDTQARHIHGEIRAFLEGHARNRWPDLFSTPNQTLERLVQTLKRQPAERTELTSLTEQQLAELDRLCAFGALGNHSGGHRSVEAPTADAVRVEARKALELFR